MGRYKGFELSFNVAVLLETVWVYRVMKRMDSCSGGVCHRELADGDTEV